MSKSKSAETTSACGILYVVATPIGNLGDFSPRAIQIAASVAMIACEDTRVTGVLLHHYGIKTPTTSYHEHNAEAVRPRLLALLAEGKNVALMSDAGTPLISDPGYKLVREVQDEGFAVVTVPGASSVTAALSIAGMPTDTFYFAGFLPHKSRARQTQLRSLCALSATLVFLESSHRLTDALRDVHMTLGNREVAICRELTKKFEEVRRGDVTDIIAHYEEHPPKGEIVLLVAGTKDTPRMEDTMIDALLLTLLASHPLKEAVAIACEQTGLPRKEIYAHALRIKPDA